MAPVPNLQLVLSQHVLDALHEGTLVVGDQPDERSLLHTEQQQDDPRLRCRLRRKVHTASLLEGNTQNDTLTEHGQNSFQQDVVMKKNEKNKDGNCCCCLKPSQPLRLHIREIKI